MAAALTCPYCGHSIASDDEAPPIERCPKCEGELLLAYRYQLVRARGEIAGGVLYQATDAGFAQPVAVLFVADPNDRAAVDRFVTGHRLFANLRTRGLVGIHEVSRPTHQRPYVVMDWLAGSTLDRVVGKSGAIDPQHVWAMTSSLLIGLERAHRALPALVHGQLHPGKIGFRKPNVESGDAVLFGFEWARLVSEQDSSLADSFSADAEAGVEVERASALDLRALARSLVYAATGRWIEDGTRERQRQQAAEMMPGPMAPFIDRLLAAGTPEGYMSTSVARDEFELIRAGGERRKTRGPVSPPQRSFSAAPTAHVDVGDGDDDDHDDDDHDHDDDDHDAAPHPSVAANVEQLRQRQTQLAALQAAAASQSAKKSGSGLGWVVALSVVFGLFMIGVLAENEENRESPQASAKPQAAATIEPIPQWTPPEVAEPVPVPGPALPLARGFEARQWSAKVESALAGGPIRAGGKCELGVIPQPEDTTFNCKWAVDCKERSGWTRYYGNGGSGLGICEFEADTLVHFSDVRDDDGDGIMVFDARGEHPWLLFGDRLANPARVVLMRIEGSSTPSGVPKHANAKELVRRGIDDVGDDEYQVAGLEIDRLAASVQLDLDLVADGDSGLPETLDIFALQTTIDAIQPSLLGCSAPEGTRVEVGLTIAGGTGTPTTIDLTNTADGNHEICLRAVLQSAQFGHFTAETMTVNWTIVY